MLLINLLTSLFSILKVKSLECVLMINQKCMSRPKNIDVNSDESVFYPLNIKVNKCSGNYNNINDPFAKLCVPNVVKNINVKVFNLLSRIKETKQIMWHEPCKCVCRLTAAVCNNRQVWNENKCACECKEDLISKLTCDSGYMWNPSMYSCECDKLCGVGQYLDYENCVCRKSLISNLVEQCTRAVDAELDNDYQSNTSTSTNAGTTYMILFVVSLILASVFAGSFCYYYRKYIIDL